MANLVVAEFSKPDTFDFVIVGAGSAGCVLASRLSALPQAPSVCLIERGPSHTDNRWNVAMPLGFRYNLSFANQPDMWLRTLSVPEKQLDGRRVECARGSGWGGGSIANGMAFVRGQPDDFENWAKEHFCTERWSFDQCLQYFKRIESYTSGIEEADTIDYETEMECSNKIPDYRGFEGPMNVVNCRVLNRKFSKCPYSLAFIRAGIQAGHKYNPDCNGTEQEGVGWVDLNISDVTGFRQSASRCYLLPALSRKNLTVLSNAFVSRVILEDKRAVGVEFYDTKGSEHIVKARKEIILSAGALSSPQILMLSGIGDPEELRKVGIDPIHMLPGVGRTMQDHTLLVLNYETRRPEFSYPHCDWKTINTEWTDRVQTQWETSKDGQGVTTFVETIMHFKTNAHVRTPNMKVAMLNLRPEAQPNGAVHFKPGMSAYFHNQCPLSEGSLKLFSKSVFDDPIIELNYFTEQSEIREFIDGVNVVRNVLSQSAIAEYIGHELFPGAQVSSDAELEKFIRSTAKSGFHWTGTCRMGDPDAAPTPEAARKLVVDAELRVCGLNGLRVVDASVMPSITSANIHASVLMIAERASDFIADFI